jgi:hypothetical protein
MALTTLLDLVRDFLQSTLDPTPALIGDGYPIEANQLPAVTISLSGVTEPLRGVGRLPAPTLRGALPVQTALDLSDPVVTFPDEVVNLLSGDRRTVSLAHGPLVREDGSATQPWGAGDIQVAVGPTTFTPVEDAPAAGEVQVLPDVGQLVFASPLPATGTLQIDSFVGEWEVRTARYQGLLSLEVFAADLGGVDALSRQLDAAFEDSSIAGLQQLSPASWGPVGAPDDLRGTSRGRALTYRFDYELIEPKLAAGGGLISTFTVRPTPGEQFELTTEGS